MNSVRIAHTLVSKPSNKALMGQVSRKSDPSPLSAKFRCILANYIKPRSTWIRETFLGKKKEKNKL